MYVIGITGTLGAGKGTVVEYLVSKYGFTHYSARAFILEEVRRRGLPENRDSTTFIADSLRREQHPGYIIESLYAQASKVGDNAVIESVRALGELSFLRKQPHFTLFGIDADVRVRYERISKRKSITDQVSFEQFISQEEREMGSGDPTRGDIRGCLKEADIVFQNSGTLDDLHRQIDAAMQHIGFSLAHSATH